MNIIKLKSTTSTNDVLKQQIKNGLDEDTLLMADEQTHGRGQRDKTWISHKQTGFYGSFYLNEPLSYQKAFLIALLSLKHVFNQYDLSPKLKLPNDVYLENKKVSGILIERNHESNKAVIGIGINLTTAPLKTSTCLHDVASQAIDLSTLTHDLIKAIQQIRKTHTSALFQTFRSWVQSSPMFVMHNDQCAEIIDIDENFTLVTTQETVHFYDAVVHYGRCKLK